jgi:hypothetical protein
VIKQWPIVRRTQRYFLANEALSLNAGTVSVDIVHELDFSIREPDDLEDWQPILSTQKGTQPSASELDICIVQDWEVEFSSMFIEPR